MADNSAVQKKGLFARIKDYVRGVVSELKKVTWPSKKEVINYSIVVVLFMIIMGIVIGVLDLGAGKLVNLLVKL